MYDKITNELKNIELELDKLRTSRFERFHTAMLGILLYTGAATSESMEGCIMAIGFYSAFAIATVSTQVSMSELKERRSTLHLILKKK